MGDGGIGSLLSLTDKPDRTLARDLGAVEFEDRDGMTVWHLKDHAPLTQGCSLAVIKDLSGGELAFTRNVRL